MIDPYPVGDANKNVSSASVDLMASNFLITMQIEIDIDSIHNRLFH